MKGILSLNRKITLRDILTVLLLHIKYTLTFIHYILFLITKIWFLSWTFAGYFQGQTFIAIKILTSVSDINKLQKS